ncbi:MAG: FGGY-family carbohydrate kinase, partial [Eubacterium sp.]
NEPELWRRSYKYIFLSTYLIAKLTGKIIDSKSDIAGHFPFDFKNKQWCGPYEIKRQIIQIEREKLCDLVDSCAVIGVLSKQASLLTGLPEGLKLIGSGTDKGCETIGVGCVDSHTASVSLGTQSTVETTADRYYELVPFYPPFPSVDPLCYNPEITVYHGFWMIDWFIETFVQKERDAISSKGGNILEFLDAQLDTIPAGSEGLLLQPFWGMESFRPEAKGSMIGFTEKHTKYHIYKSIIEGIAFALLEGIKKIEQKSHIPIKSIGLSGGGSRSDPVAQIMADVFGREVYRVQTGETTGLGGAMATYVGLGIYKDLKEANEKMVHKSKIFVPDKKKKTLYQTLYNQVYKKAYARYKPLYKHLQMINS